MQQILPPSGEEIVSRPETRFAPANPVWRSLSFALIHCVMTPFARLGSILRLRHTIIGKEKLRGHRRSGYFLFGALPDHDCRDIPLALCDPKHTYRVVPSRKNRRGDTVISPWKQLCGDIPTPADSRDTRGFLEAVEKRTVQKGAVVIYPELLEGTEIDPYSLPARFDEPAFCFTITRETDENGKEKTVTRLDGPFYPRFGFPLEVEAAELRARITASMQSHPEQEDGHEKA